MKWIKRISILFVIGIVVALLIFKFVINKPTANLKNSTADYNFTASAFLNQLATADSNGIKKYNDKVIQITGLVKAVTPNDSATMVTLGDSTTNTIQCQIDTRNNETAKLIQPNTTVVIKGKMAGVAKEDDPMLAELGINVVLNTCTLVANK